MKYEKVTFYVDVKTVIALAKALDVALGHGWVDDETEIVQRDLRNIHSELRARIQHLPDGIERAKVEDAGWLG